MEVKTWKNALVAASFGLCFASVGLAAGQDRTASSFRSAEGTSQLILNRSCWCTTYAKPLGVLKEYTKYGRSARQACIRSRHHCRTINLGAEPCYVMDYGCNDAE